MHALTLAQTTDGAGATNAWSLFVDSFDVFTIALILGSLVAVTLIARVVMDARQSVIAPDSIYQNLRSNLIQKNTGGFEKGLSDRTAIVSIACKAAYDARTKGRDAMRDAAEIAASNACARWSRPLDLLRIIGELGPLVGLAGTVWGMIIAFVRLGQAGGANGSVAGHLQGTVPHDARVGPRDPMPSDLRDLPIARREALQQRDGAGG